MTLEMRNSERATLRSCAQKWFWSTVEGLAPVRSATPLWFGSAVHEGLAAWYRKGLLRGPHPAETFEKFLVGDRKFLVTNEEDELVYEDARVLGNDMLVRYVDEYGKDEEWFVIATEKTFRVWLKRPAQDIFGVHFPEKARWLRLVGTWDGVYRNRTTGEIWLMEHKTAASIRVDHLSLDDQAGTYYAVASRILQKMGILKPGERIAGIMYNFLRKALADPRPKNYDGLYTNKPVRQNYIDALINHFGQDSSPEEMVETEEWLNSLKLPDLAANAETQKIEVFGDVSKSQPPAYFERFPVFKSAAAGRRQIRRIQDDALFAEAYREGFLPVVKSPDKQRCSFCEFKRMCELDEQGDQLAVEEFKSSQFIVRNPYEDHVRKSAE